MNFFSRSLSFTRRLSVFFLFAAVFSIFFGVFYYKYIPNNQADLNTRGFRVLNKFSQNIVLKYENLGEIFRNTANADSAIRWQVYSQIAEQIPYIFGDWQKLQFTTDSQSIQVYDSRELSIIFPGKPMVKNKVEELPVVISVKDFMEPELGAREDLFDTYMVLEKGQTAWGDNRVMKVLYGGNISPSSLGLNTDSALTLQKNTDLSNITDVVIGGSTYTMFFQPFTLGTHNLVLAGLLSKATYEKKVRMLPMHFVVGVVMVILLGLIILPFLKVFFISPKENVFKYDVLSIMLSIYIGSSLLVLAGVFFLADYSAQNRVSATLRDLSGTLEAEIYSNVEGASRQMDTYARTYQNLDPSLKGVLTTADTDTTHAKWVDSEFRPSHYDNVSRIFWVDSAGMTMSKWNLFNFVSPLTSVSNFLYFTRIKNKSKADESLVLDAAKSNITAEFQLILARRKKMKVWTPKDTTGYSIGIIMAAFPNASLRPVLPMGYGFALVNNETMDVLMHSDYRRSLSENMSSETDGNPRLKHCIKFGNEAEIDGVDLYGTPHMVYVKPVRGQNVSLVVFYDAGTFANNLVRMQHFGGETVLYLALAMAICVLFSTNMSLKPSKLTFNLAPVEWIRPLARNWKSYAYTKHFFGILLALYLVTTVSIWLADADARIIFYISLLLPFYAMWGFVASRKREEPAFPPEARLFGDMLGAPAPMKGKFVRSVKTSRFGWVLEPFAYSKTTFLFLLFVNFIIVQLISNSNMQHGASVIMVVMAFQLVAFSAMEACYYFTFKHWRDPGDHSSVNAYRRNYMWSLYMSILVMSMLPTIGIMWYSWTVEKIQYARSDLLDMADKNVARMKYLSVKLIPGIKPTIMNSMGGTNSYKVNLMQLGGVYLGEGRSIDYHNMYGLEGPSNDPDQPYVSMLDKSYVITAGEFNKYSVGTSAKDSSWVFVSKYPKSIYLHRRAQYSPTGAMIASSDPLIRDFTIGSTLNVSLFTLTDMSFLEGMLMILGIVMFLFLLPRVLALAVNRLFLLDFVMEPKTIDQKKYILPHYVNGKALEVDDYWCTNKEKLPPRDKLEECILREMLDNKSDYQALWESLPREESYILYDFAKDGYANYKDNESLFSLLRKGLLVYEEDGLRLFKASFREFVTEKKGSEEIAELRDEYAVPGVWATIRIPALIIISACGVLLLTTQESLSHQVTMLVTSVGAILPVLLDITKKVTGKGGG